MDQSTAQNLLIAGAEILKPVLEPFHFTFTFETHGKGSGGWFASGAYQKEDRRLELHFRYSLGLVTYHIGQDYIEHETYMRLLGVFGRNQYPDFPGEPLESFHHLVHDIQSYCQDFISGDGQQFHLLAKDLIKNPSLFRGIP